MIAAVFLMLAACTTMDSDGLLNNEPEEKQARSVTEEKAPAQFKETEISPEVLFQLMTAEIAGQRKQYKVALEGYLRASRQVKDPEVIKRAAKIALYVQDEAKLGQVLDLWLESEPESLDARYLMAIAALKSGDKQAATENIDFILNRDVEGFDSKAIGMVKNLNTPQNSALAYQVFAELSVKYPENAQLYFIQALLDAQVNKVEQAQSGIARALELKPRWMKALILQAQLYIAVDKLPEATEALTRAVEVQDSVRLREQIVQLLIQQRRLEEAQDAVSSLMSRYPENKGLKFKAALVYLQTGEEEQARDILETLVIEKGFRDKSAFYLGRMDAKAKRFDEALKWLDAVGMKPYRFDAGVSAILIRMDLKRYELALDNIKALRKDYPMKKNELALLESEIYSQKGLPQQGFDILTAALAEDSENNRVLYARALMAEKLGQLQVLEDDLKHILRKDPQDANALNALGYTLVDKTTRYQEAKTYLDQALSIKPNEPVILDSYGWLLFKLQRLDESLVYLQRAFDKVPQAEIAAHLVEVLWALEKQVQARAVLTEALEKNPNDKLLLDVRQRLLGVD